MCGCARACAHVRVPVGMYVRTCVQVVCVEHARACMCVCKCVRRRVWNTCECVKLTWFSDNVDGKGSGPASIIPLKQIGANIYINSAVKLHPPQLDMIDVSSIDAIVITNFFNILALPYITEYTNFSGKIYATEPTVQIGRYCRFSMSLVLDCPANNAHTTHSYMHTPCTLLAHVCIHTSHSHTSHAHHTHTHSSHAHTAHTLTNFLKACVIA